MADPEHDIARVVAAIAAAPAEQLRFKVGGGLTGEWRVGGSTSFARKAVAARAGGYPACGIAMDEQAGSRRGCGSAGRRGKGGIEMRDAQPLPRIELAGDPAHLRMPPAAVGKGFELPLEISRIQRGEAGSAAAVALSAQPVAREAGVDRAGTAAAQRDHFAGCREAAGGPVVQLGAAGKQEAGRKDQRTVGGFHRWSRTGTPRHRFPLAICLVSAITLGTAACKQPPERSQSFPTASAQRGKQLIEQVGCASCHTIEGISWPKGRAAPELRGLTGRALIAGQIPNQPEMLAAFIRNAPAVLPGTTMPAMPLSERQSRDVAAYLYRIGS